MLSGKVAVIYGGGGVIGGHVARSFAREGAQVVIAGRTQEKLDRVVDDIRAAGGTATTAVVDALDPAAVERFLDGVMASVGRLDVSFNATGEDQSDFGIPLIDIDPERFGTILTTWTRSLFVTATAAARRMGPAGGGIILTISSSVAQMPDAMSGGLHSACIAVEAMSRQMAQEFGSQGIRVVCIRPDGISESAGMGSITAAVWTRAMGRMGSSLDEMLDNPEETAMGRTVSLAEVVDTATFLASGRASGISGTVVNVSVGNIRD